MVEPALLGLLLLDWEDAVADAVGVVAVAAGPAVDERVTPCITSVSNYSAKEVKGYTASLQASWAVATAVAKSVEEQLCWKH